jgi:purine-binding chemotaxis protein CheW
VSIVDAEIEDAPTFGEAIRTEYLLGIGKAQGRVKLLLDIDRVLSGDDLAAAAAVAEAADAAS